MMYLYRNLRTGLWQYGDKPKQPVKGADGKAIGFSAVLMRDVTFKLSETSRQRCLRQLAEKMGYGWDVHAYAVGEIVKDPARYSCPIPITYDKAGTGQFIRKDTGATITSCELVLFAADGHCYAAGVR